MFPRGFMRSFWIASVLAGGALVAFSVPGLAAAKKNGQQADPRIGVLEQQLRDVQQQLAEIKSRQGQSDNSAALLDLKRSTSAQYEDVNHQFGSQTRVGIANGRLNFASADGAFTLALRSLVQFDAAYFGQGRNPASVDLNSGTNFRRAQLGLQGTVYSDWAYNFTYDFGGNGGENRGYIYNAYIEYDGLRPFYFRAGAYTPFEGLDDQMGSGDLFFMERASAADIARNIAGAPSREAISIWTQGDNYLVALSYTGKKTTDNLSTGALVGTFDAQQALIGRASWLAYSDSETKWLLDGHITEVLKLPDTVANTASGIIRLSNGPEITVDASRTVDTGSLDAKQVREFGFETAATYDALYAQGGWFRYDVERRTAVPNPHFSGWYAFVTYALTGEQHPYDPGTASFRNIRPAKPLGTPDGLGAFELAARYSSINLDYLPFATGANGGVPGGKQDVWTVGLNWYPNNVIKFQLDYENLQVNHGNAPANDISANVIALRSQIQL